MRTMVCGLVAVAGLVLPGCPGGARPKGLQGASVVSEGLAVRLELSTWELAAGREFQVTLIARNTTRRPLAIGARSGSPYFVGVWRDTSVGWEQVRRYPETEIMIMNPWTLDPGQQRTFPCHLRVEPDWPTGERLRLTGELNGRPDAVAEVMIYVPPEPEAAE